MRTLISNKVIPKEASSSKYFPQGHLPSIHFPRSVLSQPGEGAGISGSWFSHCPEKRMRFMVNFFAPMFPYPKKELLDLNFLCCCGCNPEHQHFSYCLQNKVGNSNGITSIRNHVATSQRPQTALQRAPVTPNTV